MSTRLQEGDLPAKFKKNVRKMKRKCNKFLVILRPKTVS
ncbi:hypothetical protein KKC1_18650 [Calderihabitans maritimus]|uniref:Uncharacterized protein n=1 Tax=Calderihabitans maritimus TaxID=1246530 RepID=A0A1Z5HTS4_9FIRM|nr:hypothetical protein KKC1_18650 [Calderihabitans maritimus]